MDTLTRIMSDKIRIIINDTPYYYNQTKDWELEHQIQLFRQDLYDSCKYDSWLSDKGALLFLKQAGLIPLNYEKMIQELSENIMNLKVNLYENRQQEKEVKKIRNRIRATEEQYYTLSSIANSLNRYTLDGYVDYEAELYMVSKKINNIPKEVDIVSIRDKVIEQMPSLDEIREVAKSHIWRTMWVAKKDWFTTNTLVSDNFIRLISMSKMYDSVHEHPNQPEAEVIQDNDMLDGWFIYENRKYEKEKLKNKIDSSLPSGGGNEVFYKTRSREEAMKIEELNSAAAKRIKENRRKLAKAKGTITDKDLALYERG